MKQTDEEKLARLFDRLDIYAASSPYWPEMLDFDLPENTVEERREITEYLAHFGAKH